VTCDSHEKITEINLMDSGLVTTIPEAIGQLTHLKQLFLSENKIFGTIPASVGSGLPNLVSFDVYSNELRGRVPRFLNRHLEVLNLSHNQFSSKLPNSIGAGLEKLRSFDAGHNFIGGTLPDSLVRMKNLKELNLSNNKFNGSIPENLGNLSNLEGLFLSNNNLVGTLPTSLTQENLLLREIFLHGNRLSGKIPVSMADLPHLKILFIDENKFTGTIPEELCRKSINAAFFDGFSKDGSNVSGTSSSTGVNGIDNGCSTIACPAGFRSTVIKETEGRFSCTTCDQGHTNPYLGARKCYDTSNVKILEKLFTSTDGGNWVGVGESWVGYPICERKGITCDSAGDIVEIRLPRMNLSGSIPEELGFLRHVKVLDLSGNSLYGLLPSELQFLPLKTLDISGNMILGPVPGNLCSKGGLNGNGKGGDLNCNNIACATGTFSEIGRAKHGSDCMPCDTIFIGSNTCAAGSHGSGYFSGVELVAYTLLLGFGMLMILRYRSIGRSIGIPSNLIDDKDVMVEFDHETDTFSISTESLTRESFPETVNKPTWGKKKDDNEDVWLDVPQVS